MLRKRTYSSKKPKFQYIVRFFPAGNYNWIVPSGCVEVDVFLVGAGGGGGSCIYTSGGEWPYSVSGGGGSGYTKTYKKDNTGIKQGNEISVVAGQSIPLIVGKGGGNGGFSQFLDSEHQALGGSRGVNSTTNTGPTSGGVGGSNGGNGYGGVGGSNGAAQGYTSRDFGEPSGKRNAGAGGGGSAGGTGGAGGVSDYINGSGLRADHNAANRGYGGGGYGGGGGGGFYNQFSGGVLGGLGGDGTVLLRFIADEGYVAPAGGTIEKITPL